MKTLEALDLLAEAAPRTPETDCLHGGPTDEAWDWKSDTEFVAKLRMDLKRQAAFFLRSGVRELSASSLVQESLLRLLTADCLRKSEDRNYVYSLACTAMRWALVDHVRARQSLKRGGQHVRTSLDVAVTVMQEQHIDILAMHEAMERLSERNPRQAQVVDLKFFGNLTMPEIARRLQLSTKTIEGDWTEARKWLYRFMSQ